MSRRMGQDWPSRTRLSRRAVVRRGVVSGGAIVAGGLLAGCASTPAAPATAPAAAVATSAPAAASAPTATTVPQPKYGGTFRYNVVGKPPHLDMHQTATTILIYGPAAAYGRLLNYKYGSDVPAGSFTPQGDLAESWEQPDELTYLFKIRRNAKFHNIAPVNGREATAEDVQYSFRRQIDLKTNASNLPQLDKVEAVDRYTLKLTAPKPDADFFLTLAGPLNRVVAHEVVDLKGDLKEGPIIGTGPWILDKFELGSFTTLKRNPDYYKKVPYVDTYETTNIGDEQSAMGEFRTHKQIVPPTGTTRPQLESLKKEFPELQLFTVKVSGFGMEFVLNAQTPPFTDVRVREAVSKAINRQEIIDTIAFGLGWHSAGIALPDLSYALPEDEVKSLTKQDIPGAKKLLADAGMPNGFDFDLDVLNFGESPKNTAELVTAQLKQIGVNGKIRLIDTTTLTDRVRGRGEFAAIVTLFGISIPWQSMFNRFHTKGTQNIRLNDPKLDEMIERQNTLGKNPDQRKQLIQDIQRYIIKSYAYLCLRTNEDPSATWPEFKNLTPHAATGDVDRFAYVWVDK